MDFAVGSLVRVREREWVVLPESTPDFLHLRPLGGTEDEVTGIDATLEYVEPAQFALPDPTQVGDYRSSRLLRDAVRLGFRSSAGPFRSFGKIAVEPRPYQLVPLLMALKLETVRLLIADDVGIGKTVEASLIARELLDRGEIERLAVLCPPQLAEQWQAELLNKFHIEAELVLPSTATRLERQCRLGESLFDHYNFVVVSLDFIKSERRREEFLRTCPEFVIVDEAHTCAFGSERGRHQRHELVVRLAEDKHRHMVLVTATPHSGNEEAFRSLLSILNSDFDNLPDDLSGVENEANRRELARYLVQRRRGDIKVYLEADTPFPLREATEENYKLSEPYQRLFNRALAYAREIVLVEKEGTLRQRVRWWSALALLRSIASSPAAAAITLRNRAATVEATTTEDVDSIGKRTVLDLLDDEAAEGIDVTPGADIDDEKTDRGRLLAMAREAEALQGAEDAKLQKLIKMLKALVSDGYNPIVFCRFIPTVEYLTEQLRGSLRGVEIMGVTGQLPPSEREQRVAELAKHPKRILVCTDCLSEGINLQEGFNAVLHYDLSWNPTRHEQREGRVDRYGQPSSKIRVVTYYGVDNRIDGIVLDVLLRKHRSIRDSLGVSVPMPIDSTQVIEAIFEGLLLRDEASQIATPYLPGFDEYMRPRKEELFKEWEVSAEREKQSRTMFAQNRINPQEVAAELALARAAIGAGVDVRDFLRNAITAHQGYFFGRQGETYSVDLQESPRALREAVHDLTAFEARFELPVQEKQIYLTRTHPFVERMATYIMDTALDAVAEGVAKRAGAMRTAHVERRTTLLLIRLRFHLSITKPNTPPQTLLVEECRLLAFEGAPDNPTWLNEAQAEALLNAEPEGNIQPEQAEQFVATVLDQFSTLMPILEEHAHERAKVLLEAHQRVRQASRSQGIRQSIEPQLPVDVLGVYVYLPVPKRS